MLVYFFTSSILLTASFFTTLRRRRWWFRLFDGMRFHVMVGMVALVIYGFVSLSTSQPPVLAFQLILIVGIIYHLTAILPFTPLAKTEIKDGNSEKTIRFLTANVRMSNHQFGRFISLVERVQPDVVLITEPNQQWVDGLRKLEMTYPHTLLHPQQNTYGMALYSRLPMAKSEVNFLIEEDVPSMHVEFLLKDGTGLQYIALHPRPPAPWTKVKDKDLELIIAATMTNWNSLPSVVTGDLNDVGWSEITRKFKVTSGLFDPRIGRGFFNTYNALFPFFRMPIDHFFVSPSFKLINMKRLEKIGSDHFPVMVELGF